MNEKESEEQKAVGSKLRRPFPMKPPLGLLMGDFRATNPSNMYYKALAEEARRLKESEEGVNSMCRELENMRAESFEEGERAKTVRAVLNGLSQNMTVKALSSLLEISIDDVKKIAQENGLDILKFALH